MKKLKWYSMVKKYRWWKKSGQVGSEREIQGLRGPGKSASRAGRLEADRAGGKWNSTAGLQSAGGALVSCTS